MQINRIIYKRVFTIGIYINLHVLQKDPEVHLMGDQNLHILNTQ